MASHVLFVGGSSPTRWRRPAMAQAARNVKATAVKSRMVKDLAVGPDQEVKGGAPRATLKQRTAAFERAVGDNDVTEEEYWN
jgi:hypothetical protein